MMEDIPRDTMNYFLFHELHHTGACKGNSKELISNDHFTQSLQNVNSERAGQVKIQFFNVKRQT